MKNPSDSKPDKPFDFHFSNIQLLKKIEAAGESLDPNDPQAVQRLVDLCAEAGFKLEPVEEAVPVKKRKMPRPIPDICSLKWIEKDRIIQDQFARYPSYVRFSKYIHSRNLRWRGDQFKAMVEEADAITGGRRYHDEHPFSTLLVNKAFYEEIYQACNISRPMTLRLVAASASFGRIVLLADCGRTGSLIADGYFQTLPDNGKIVKRSFQKRDDRIIEGLRSLDSLIKIYQPMRVL